MAVDLLGSTLQLPEVVFGLAVVVAVVLTLDGEFNYVSELLPADYELSMLPRVAVSTVILGVGTLQYIYHKGEGNVAVTGGLDLLINELAFALFGAIILAAVVGVILRRR